MAHLRPRRTPKEEAVSSHAQAVPHPGATPGRSPGASPSRSPGVVNGRRVLYWLLCGGVTLGLLGWSLRDLSLSDLGSSLAGLNYGWLSLALGAYLMVFALRAWRWGLLLAADCWPGRFRDRFHAFFVGYAANSILPAAAGEVVRVVLLNRLAQVPVQSALGSVLGEKLMDVLVVFLILLALLAQQPQLSGSLPLGLLGAIIGLSCALFWLLARYPRPVVRGCGVLLRALGLSRWRAAFESSLMGVLGGLKIFRQPGRFLITLGVSLLSWLINGVTYWAVLLALGITAPGWMGSLITQSLAAFAIALPSSPGFVGPFEAAVRFGLNLYQVPGTEAIAVALLLRIVMYVMTPLLGLVWALRLGLSRADLLTASPPIQVPQESDLGVLPSIQEVHSGPIRPSSLP
jgi:glycosyltransferase 2 family protein